MTNLSTTESIVKRNNCSLDHDIKFTPQLRVSFCIYFKTKLPLFSVSSIWHNWFNELFSDCYLEEIIHILWSSFMYWIWYQYFCEIIKFNTIMKLSLILCILDYLTIRSKFNHILYWRNPKVMGKNQDTLACFNVVTLGLHYWPHF